MCSINLTPDGERLQRLSHLLREHLDVTDGVPSSNRWDTDLNGAVAAQLEHQINRLAALRLALLAPSLAPCLDTLCSVELQHQLDEAGAADTYLVDGVPLGVVRQLRALLAPTGGEAP